MFLLSLLRTITCVEFVCSFCFYNEAVYFKSGSKIVGYLAKATNNYNIFEQPNLKLAQRSNKRRFLIELRKRLPEGDDDEELPETPSKFDSSAEVDNILQQIATALVPYKVNNDIDDTTDAQEKLVSIDEIKQRFEEIFSKVRRSSISDAEKNQVFAEASMIISNAEDEESSIKNAINVFGKKNILSTKLDKVPVYSSSFAPIVVVRGKGAVTRQVNSISGDLGTAGVFRFLEADQLAVIRDSDLKYALKGAKSVVIIADSEYTETKNWFGQIQRDEGPCPLTINGLKKLLNAVMAEEVNSVASGSKSSGIKVSILGRASSPSQSIMSSILGDGSGGSLSEEAQLMCAQRQLAYSHVKVGRLLEDSQPFPSGVRDRSVGGSSPDPGSSPVLFTKSSTVEWSEVTYASVAAEALLRSLSHPHRNSSVSVLSTAFACPNYNSSTTATCRMPSGVQWEDQFLKIHPEFPELLRLRLTFCSSRQAALALYRAAEAVTKKDGGLVTPVEMERFSNGVRLLFRPPESSYLSKKEEQEQLRQMQLQSEREEGVGKGAARRGAYKTPEQEAKEEKERLQKDQEGQVRAAEKVTKQKPRRLEGGLELVAESSPYARIRVRRCAMGPQTVSKLESEQVVLTAVRRYLDIAERDSRILLDKGQLQ